MDCYVGDVIQDWDSSKISGASLMSALKCGIYSQTTEGTDKTGTTYQSILSGTGVGSLSVPANGFVVGDTYHADLCGIMSSINNDDISVQINAGPTSAVTLLSFNQVLKNATDKVFTLKMKFVVRAIGTRYDAVSVVCVAANSYRIIGNATAV